MVLLRARFGHDVDGRASISAVFRLVIADQHLDFFDGIDVHGAREIAAAHVVAGHPIDELLVVAGLVTQGGGGVAAVVAAQGLGVGLPRKSWNRLQERDIVPSANLYVA